MRRIFYLLTREVKRVIKVGPIKYSLWLSWFTICSYAWFRREFSLFFKLRNGKRFLIREIQGSKMYLDMRDIGLSRELAFEDIREPVCTRTFQSEIKEGDVIVDIGANIGYYALMEARLVGPTGRVYAIEPVPDTMQILRRNIELNGYSNIETFSLAMGEENGKATLYAYRDWNHCSLTPPAKVDPAASRLLDKLDVDVVTLDEFLKDKNHPDWIRMDVEGYEYNIIKGMKNLLDSGRPLKLFIELHPFLDVVKPLLATLKEHGFEVKKAIYDGPPPVLMNPPIVRKIVEFVNKKRLNQNMNFGYQNMTLDDMLKSSFFTEGKFEWFSIFVERS